MASNFSSTTKRIQARPLHGFGTAAGPAPFRGGATGVVKPPIKRRLKASPTLPERMQASNLFREEATTPRQRNLLGPRITHIGHGAIAGTQFLENLEAKRTKQTPLFQQNPISSRARQTGRPLGYGTIYKFF